MLAASLVVVLSGCSGLLREPQVVLVNDTPAPVHIVIKTLWESCGEEISSDVPPGGMVTMWLLADSSPSAQAKAQVFRQGEGTPACTVRFRRSDGPCALRERDGQLVAERFSWEHAQ